MILNKKLFFKTKFTQFKRIRFKVFYIMEITLKTQNKERHNTSMGMSRFYSNKKVPSKLSVYETNLDNYNQYNQTNKFGTQKIDPKGIPATGVYASFSGVIQSLQLFSDEDVDLQINYQIKIGKQWHDQTPEVNDTTGVSTFCSSKNGKITFSLGFDTLVSCMYIQSWPQLLLTIRGFDIDGNIITKGYAQIHLPTIPGMQVKQAAVYQIVRNVKWYHKWIPFLEPTFVSYDKKQFQRIIEKGEGRESEKIRCIGRLKIRAQVLLRNFTRFGYQ